MVSALTKSKSGTVWTVRFSTAADRQFGKLGKIVQRRILRFIETRIVHDPRQVGAALKGDERAWKYRIGDYRLVCDIVDDTVTVYVIKVGHRREVYR